MPTRHQFDHSIPEDDDPGPRRQRRKIHRCDNRTCGAADCETCRPESEIGNVEILEIFDEEEEIS